MRWSVFAIMVYLAVGLQEGLRTLLVIGYTSPSFLLILLVFIAVHAPRSTVAWSAMILGILVDLKPVPLTDQYADVAVIGPGCLGYLAGGLVVIHLRSMVFRESAMTVAALVLAAGVFIHLIIVALLTMRGLPWLLGEPIRGWNVADQLVDRFLEIVYTAAWAVPIAMGLNRLEPLWGFSLHIGAGRRHPSYRSNR